MKRFNVAHRRTRFALLYAILFVLIFARYSFMLSIPRLLITAFAVLIACLGDRDEVVAACIACVPLYIAVSPYIVIALSIVVYVIKFPEDIRIGPEIMLVVLLVLWELLHCLQGSFALKDFLACVFPYILCVFLFFISKVDLDYVLITRVFSLSALLVAVSLFVQIFYLADFNLAEAIANLQRLGLVEEDAVLGVDNGAVNPNSLGVLCVLGISGLMQLAVSKQNVRGTILLSVLLVISGILTLSRTFLVCLVAMVACFIFVQKRTFSETVKLILTIAILVAAVYTFIYVFLPDTLAAFEKRLQGDDLTSGRIELLKAYNVFIFSSLRVVLFGVGLTNLGHKVIVQHRVASHIPHNGIQEILVAWGIPGLILIVAFLVGIVLKAHKKNRNLKFINFIPMIILLLKVQAGQMISSIYTMTAFSFAYLSLCQDFSGNELRNNRLQARNSM